MAWLIGSEPSVSPTRNTASHSRPLAACNDDNVTPWTVGGWRASARADSSADRSGRVSSGFSAIMSSVSCSSAFRDSQRARAWAPDGSSADSPSSPSTDRTTSRVPTPGRTSRPATDASWRIA